MVDETPINNMPEDIKIEVIGAISTTFRTHMTASSSGLSSEIYVVLVVTSKN
jgi:hypothetical protein